MAEILVHLKHVRNIRNYCNKGARSELAKYNIDWNDLVFKGIPISKFRAVNDARFQEVADFAERDV